MRKVLTSVAMFFLSFTIISCGYTDSTSSIQTTNELITVIFDTDGGSTVEPLVTTTGSNITIITPHKEGFTFTGWYTGSGASDPQFTELSTVTTDITLYARWQINQYTISFDNNEGSEVSSITQDYGSIVTKPNDPVKAGFTFEGWYRDAELATIYNFTTIPAENITLYAKWNINIYTLQFQDDDGTVLQTTAYQYQADLSSVLSPVVTKAGYHFLDWDISLPLTMPANNLVLTAMYAINQYTITFDSKGGSLVFDIALNYGTPVTQPCNPTKSGFTFGGWYLDTEIMVVYSFTTMPAEDITLYAKWDPVLYEVTYVLNYGDSIIVNEDYAGNDLIIPTYVGFQFEGWYLDSNFLQEVESYTIPAMDVTLYAKWSLVTYNICYWLYAGTNDDENPKSYTILTDDFTFKVPIKDGYSFIGWYDNPEFLGTPVEYLFEGSYGDITLYANWQINQYSVSYYIYEDYDPLTSIILFLNETIVSVSLGGNHSSVLTSSGRLFIWGDNSFGQIGDGTTIDRATPVDITNGFNLFAGEIIVSVSLGSNHSSAITSNGRVFTWGNNDSGQLGDNTTIKRITPVNITDFFCLSTLETIVSVSLGKGHSSALSSNGRVFTWGNNNSGQLGDGTTLTKKTPTEITSSFILNGSEIIVSVELGAFHSAAITSSGRIFLWGNNYYGQIGDGTIANRNIPTEITSRFNLTEMETIMSVSLGSAHSSAITSDRRIFTWGYNYYGQLGDGTSVDNIIPTEITGGFNLTEGEMIVSISLGADGYSNSSALTSTGRVFTWGPNNKGQLGNGTNTTSANSTPIDITSNMNLEEGEIITLVSLGSYHASALTSNGNIYIWGDNYFGQLGDGSTTNSNLPSIISTVSPRYIHSDIYVFSALLYEYNVSIEGYTFSGWYSDIYLISEYTFTTMHSCDLILYGALIINP